MIRANLLPRPKERVGIAGIDFDAEYLRQSLLALAIVAIVAFAGVGIESLRVSRLETATAEQDRAIAANAPQRAEVKALALEVARYQSFAREAQAFRRSGADAAVALARIGNSVPERVWLTSLEHQTAGYDLVGAARSVDVLGGTMLSLARALPGANATLVNIDNRDRGEGVRFTARVAERATPGANATAEHIFPAGIASPAPGASPAPAAPAARGAFRAPGEFPARDASRAAETAR